MFGIHDALDHWKARVFRQPLDKYPIVWAGHFSGSASLGSFGVGVLPEGDVAKVVHAVTFPFALSPTVEATYVVIDEAPPRSSSLSLTTGNGGASSAAIGTPTHARS
jgi:hypothetical protein